MTKGARGADSSDRLTVFALAFAVYLLITFLESVVGYLNLWVAVLVNPVASFAVGGLMWGAIGRVGAVAESLLMPTGTPPVAQFSAEDALIARGHFTEAAAALQRHLATDPANVAAHLRLAALLNDHLGDRSGAAQCYHAIRNSPNSATHDWVVTNGLIDVHRAAGDRQGLQRELRRLAQQFRSTTAGRLAARSWQHFTAKMPRADRRPNVRSPVHPMLPPAVALTTSLPG